MIDLLENLFLFFNQGPDGKSSPLNSVIIGVFFAISVFLSIFELDWIFGLISPIKFIIIFALIGIAIGSIIMSFFVKTGLINMRRKEFWVPLISFILLTISLSSKLNRNGFDEFSTFKKVPIIAQPEFGENIARIPIEVEGKLMSIRTDVQIHEKYHIGDSIEIKKFSGKLGFIVIRENQPKHTNK